MADKQNQTKNSFLGIESKRAAAGEMKTNLLKEIPSSSTLKCW